MINIKETLENYRRVLKIAKKPSSEEFKMSARICAIGMAIIGIIGFIMYLIFVLLESMKVAI
jgi:protein transport protein SEC61 subunit gamma-like protein